MPEHSIAEQAKYNEINDLGVEASNFSVWSEGSLEEIEEAYKKINPENDPSIREAVEEEFKELGLDGFEITGDGEVEYDESEFSSEEREEAKLNSVVRNLTGDNADVIQKVSDLTDHGEDGEMAEEDIEAALRSDDFSEAEKQALRYLQENFDNIENQDGLMDGDDLSEEDLLKHARENGVDPGDVRQATEAAVEAQEELLREASPESLALRTHEVQAGEGFDLIARKAYMEAYGERPSVQDEIRLSQMIAQMNGNDRNYSNGYIHPGDNIRILSKEEMDQFLSDEAA